MVREREPVALLAPARRRPAKSEGLSIPPAAAPDPPACGPTLTRTPYTQSTAGYGESRPAPVSSSLRTAVPRRPDTGGGPPPPPRSGPLQSPSAPGPGPRRSQPPAPASPPTPRRAASARPYRVGGQRRGDSHSSSGGGVSEAASERRAGGQRARLKAPDTARGRLAEARGAVRRLPALGGPRAGPGRDGAEHQQRRGALGSGSGEETEARRGAGHLRLCQLEA